MTRCKKRVFGRGGWGSSNCSRKAVGEAGYCKQHDPEHQRKLAEKRGPTRSQQGMDARARLSEILDRLEEMAWSREEGITLIKEAQRLHGKLWW